MAENSYIAANEKLIQILDELLSVGDWQASLFLKTAAKQFMELRLQAQQLLAEVQRVTSIQHQERAHAFEDARVVYISVYQAEGHDLHKWHQTLKSLTDYSLSRPVYQEEEHIRAMIRAKEQVQREGYVQVLVQQQDIVALPSDKKSYDRFGNELLTLKAGVVKPEHIVEFVHGEQRYQFQQDALVLK